MSNVDYSIDTSRTGYYRGRSNATYSSGKKIGRPRKYESLEEAKKIVKEKNKINSKEYYKKNLDKIEERKNFIKKATEFYKQHLEKES
jgi:pyruvate-formate lyase